jgi:hypothetical protein
LTYYNSTGHISDPIAQNYPGPTAREVGREALGRAISYFCEGAISTCSGAGLYRFLSGYEPWCGKAGADFGDPSERARKLINEGLNNNLYGTGQLLQQDVQLIIYQPFSKFIEGDKPWQWFTTGERYSLLGNNTFGYNSQNKAILAVDNGNGCYLWMVTNNQDNLWW